LSILLIGIILRVYDEQAKQVEEVEEVDNVEEEAIVPICKGLSLPFLLPTE
jgi:hypothetical protein